MLGIAVPEARRGKPLAIVVNDHRAEDNLVASVPVNICHAVVVVALPFPRAVGVACPAPALRQFMGGGIDVVGHHLVTGIDASGQEEAGMLSVEVWSAEEML